MRFRVEGNSMLPTLKDGDLVLARTLLFRKQLKPSSIIVFFDTERSMTMIKRLVEVDIENDLYYVRGDNRNESAKIAPVRLRNIIGIIHSFKP